MIDDAARELLSRHLDGDLDTGEERALEARLKGEEALRLELVGLERVRAALQQLGASEEPPAALDKVVEPLVVGPPPVTAPRPWVRWLASAAVVVLGLTVMLEVSEHRSRQGTADWPARARERSATETADRFALAPLPTRPPAAAASPRGAADRLLAGDDPEIETAGEVPPPLEVLGPLEEPLQEGRDLDDAKDGRRKIIGPGAATPLAVL
jgi:anti-sigma factor RsiW